VFEIHIESSAEPAMKPSSSRAGEPPSRASSASAKRRWRPERSTADATSNEPSDDDVGE